MKLIKLVIAYDKRVISISFPDIESVDLYTTMYNNPAEIGMAINKILNLKLANATPQRIYISKTRLNDENKHQNIECFPVKYSFDLFDYDDVKLAYAKHLIDNQYMLKSKYNGLNKITSNYLKKYNKTNLTEKDIYNIALLYLGKNYERYRDAYFTLISIGQKIKTYKPEKQHINRTNLTKYDFEGPYFESLQDYSTRSEEAHAKVMETLSLYDNDELSRIISNPNYSLFDNEEINPMASIEDEAIILAALTANSIYELMESDEDKNKGIRR